jgi:hypothetical protein
MISIFNRAGYYVAMATKPNGRPRGGARPGAGRPKGAKSKTYRPRVEKLVARDGVLPRDVMLAAMRRHYRAGRLDDAARIAAMVAPYIHPRLTSSAVTVRPRLGEMSDAELQAFLAEVAEAEQRIGAEGLSSAKPAGSA